MFFEPLDFVMDEPTKDFIRNTVEEKLRLLMLKGWRKVDGVDVQALQERVAGLQAENEALREDLCARTACASPRVESCFITAEPQQLDETVVAEGDAEQAARIESLEAELARVLRDQLPSLKEAQLCGSRSPLRRSRGNHHQGYVELQRAHKELERKYRDLRRRLARFTERLRENMTLRGYDTELVKEALVYVGLERAQATPKAITNDRQQATFDRLYADAQRRLQRLRNRADEVHVLQRVEIHRCWEAAHNNETAQARVDHLRGLHFAAVNCNGSLQTALEVFHGEEAQSNSPRAAPVANGSASRCSTGRGRSARSTPQTLPLGKASVCLDASPAPQVEASSAPMPVRRGPGLSHGGVRRPPSAAMVAPFAVRHTPGRDGPRSATSPWPSGGLSGFGSLSQTQLAASSERQRRPSETSGNAPAAAKPRRLVFGESPAPQATTEMALALPASDGGVQQQATGELALPDKPSWTAEERAATVAALPTQARGRQVGEALAIAAAVAVGERGKGLIERCRSADAPSMDSTWSAATSATPQSSGGVTVPVVRLGDARSGREQRPVLPYTMSISSSTSISSASASSSNPPSSVASAASSARRPPPMGAGVAIARDAPTAAAGTGTSPAGSALQLQQQQNRRKAEQAPRQRRKFRDRQALQERPECQFVHPLLMTKRPMGGGCGGCGEPVVAAGQPSLATPATASAAPSARYGEVPAAVVVVPSLSRNRKDPGSRSLPALLRTPSESEEQ